MLNEAYQMVKEFHEKAIQPFAESPCLLPQNRCNTRVKWMQEELSELLNSRTIYEQADAAIDIIYYALGTLVEMGVPPDELFLLIHRSNMQKLDHIVYDDDGKIEKPKGWKHPDLEIKNIIDKI